MKNKVTLLYLLVAIAASDAQAAGSRRRASSSSTSSSGSQSSATPIDVSRERTFIIGVPRSRRVKPSEVIGNRSAEVTIARREDNNDVPSYRCPEIEFASSTKSYTKTLAGKPASISVKTLNLKAEGTSIYTALWHADFEQQLNTRHKLEEHVRYYHIQKCELDEEDSSTAIITIERELVDCTQTVYKWMNIVDDKMIWFPWETRNIEYLKTEENIKCDEGDSGDKETLEFRVPAVITE